MGGDLLCADEAVFYGQRQTVDGEELFVRLGEVWEVLDWHGMLGLEVGKGGGASTVM